jgi:hypothetical protein
LAVKLESQLQKVPFELRADAALGISIVADTLDYVASPIFATPVIGDVADVFVSATLYSLTRSKRGAIINMVEFIPVVGDLVPTYTISTLRVIRKEMTSKNRIEKQRVGRWPLRFVRNVGRFGRRNQSASRELPPPKL